MVNNTDAKFRVASLIFSMSAGIRTRAKRDCRSGNYLHCTSSGSTGDFRHPCLDLFQQQTHNSSSIDGYCVDHPGGVDFKTLLRCQYIDCKERARDSTE